MDRTILPGGRHLLFTLATGGTPDRWDRARIVVQSLKSGERRTIIEGGSDARFVPNRHLVYALGGSLFAVAFDVQRLAVSGHPVPVVEGISRAAADATGGAQFSFSRNGTLVYVADSASRSSGCNVPGEAELGAARSVRRCPADTLHHRTG